MQDLTGKEIRGYSVADKVGEGAFGAVYRAHQSAIKREVAIKIILPEYANRPDFIRGFEAEAQLVARLEHIHIVPLFDYWRDPEGAYLVMRLLPSSLKDEIKQGALTLERTATVLDQVAAALMVAHRNGVVHRDLKPPNIMQDADGNCFLADFGIAKVLSDQSNDEGDIIAGTPAYISPEQVTNGPVSPQTDIYALGVMLFEMVTGQQPFTGSNVTQLIINHLQEPLPSVLEINPDLPEVIDEIIQRATMKEPEDRYDDAMALATAFRQAIQEQPLDEEDRYATLQLKDVQNPYKGLRAFQEADAADFFGRDALIERLLQRLTEDHPLARFLAVVGASGSGKSSVVKAGVLPSLRKGMLPDSDNWYLAEMVPGTRPLRELESALRGVAQHTPERPIRDVLNDDKMGLIAAVQALLPLGGQLVLVIDQFEEAFTMASDASEREHFLELVRLAVMDPDSPVRVIVTLRADFMDHPLQYPGFGLLMQQRTEFVLPLSSQEIEATIMGPAQRVGLRVEPDLLAAIVAEVSDEPGALPLLQYALTELFMRRQGGLLTLEAYRESGGVLGALARRAEQLHESVSEATQAAIRQLFLRLVTLGEGTQDTRRRISWSELEDMAESRPAILTARDLYVEYRLLTTDRDPETREPTLEIAHEALIRQWQRLMEWLNASREDIRLQRRLSAAAAIWREAQREKSFLMSGAQLDQIQSWAGSTDVDLTEEERAFIAASVVEKRTQEAREQARRMLRIEEERRARNRLQILVAVMAVAVGLALGLTLFAFTQAQIFENAAATATVALAEADERASVAQTEAAGVAATAVVLDADLNQQRSTLVARAVALDTQLAARATAEAQRAQLLNRYLVASAQAVRDDDPALALALALEAVRQPEAAPEALALLAELVEIPPEEVRSYTRAQLIRRARQAYNARDLSCDERARYQLTLCDETEVTDE